jgi:hypothetical protein
VILLPYVSKDLDCVYRTEKGCDECGRCSIGDAVGMARSFGMESVSIQNYEDLESTLGRLKRSGVRGFIGSCCEPFYGKHRPDFERIGLPGILIDVERSTCYDLGREKEARAEAAEVLRINPRFSLDYFAKGTSIQGSKSDKQPYGCFAQSWTEVSAVTCRKVSFHSTMGISFRNR